MDRLYLNRKYTLVEVAGDGACLFNTLSMAMFGTEQHSPRIRRDIVSHIVQRYAEYVHYITNVPPHYMAGSIPTAEEYRAYMGSPYTYGDYIEAIAAAAIFHVRIMAIRVFQVERQTRQNIEWHIGLEEWPLIVTEFTGSRNAGHFNLCWPSETPFHRTSLPYVGDSSRPPLAQLAAQLNVSIDQPTLFDAVTGSQFPDQAVKEKRTAGRPKKTKKGRPKFSPLTTKAEQMQKLRAQENDENTNIRLENDRKRKVEKRSMETEAEKRKRLNNLSQQKKENLQKETEIEKKKRLDEKRQENERQTNKEGEQKRQKRLQDMRDKEIQARKAETTDERQKRLEKKRERDRQAINKETEDERKKRLENKRERELQARNSESQYERQKRLEKMKERELEARNKETVDERQKRLEKMKEREIEARNKETVDDRQKRLEKMKERNLEAKNKETVDERQKRLEEMRERELQDRNKETDDERQNRLEKMKERELQARNAETEDERTTRLEKNRERMIASREVESVETRQTRLLQDRERAVLPWKKLENSAFHYNPDISYETNASVSIGTMSIECNYCHALKWKGESPGMCCCNGKVKLEPLLDPPQPLYDLLRGNEFDSKEFLQHIRSYNNAFQMTSFGAQIVSEGNFMPTFKIQGQCYHLAGSLLPLVESQSKFLQIYFMGDETLEINQRCTNFPHINPATVQILQLMLHECNNYVISFKSAMERQPEENFKIIINADKKLATGHPGRFNAPSTDEVAILIVGQEFEKRDIVLELRNNGGLQRISELHRAYDALQYPLLYPRGEDGYCVNIPQYDPVTLQPNFQKTVSAMNFYAYRIMTRSNETNHFHLCRQLANQYWVDVYAKIESERLAYIKNNQKKLRAENYVHLKDALERDGNVQDVGQMIILPSSFTGSPRYMHERMQDAMTYVRKYGRPDLFITFTCNPKWSEISDHLLPGQQSHDRHDIVCRVFKLKVTSLMNLLIKGKVFGPVKCHMYSIEWQKRGLPHVHILVWLERKISPNEIDAFISAEIPNPSTDPALHDVIVKNMIHGPCGTYNRSSPCMKDGKCSKRYPRPFTRETKTGDDGYPTYKRRSSEDGGISVQVRTRGGMMAVDNRWVVPYCPLLSRIFNAHINVEFCNSVKSIKYLCKYINKGTDQAAFAFKNEKDEIERYQVGRFISTSEGIWRIFSFSIHDRSPAVVHLAVHLENGQRVYFTDMNVADRILNPPNTTLMAFFNLCQIDEFAKTLLYHEVPTYYTWNGTKFSRRKQGTILPAHPEIRKSNSLGRVYTVHPNNSECYHLRLLLHKIRGPTSFTDLKIANGVLYDSYQAVCRALGMLEDDNHWHETLNDAAISESPAIMRDLFVVILGFCHISDPLLLWEKHKDQLTEDIFFQLKQCFPDIPVQHDDQVYCKGLIYIEDKLYSLTSKTLADFGFPPLQRDRAVLFESEYLRETSYNIEESLQFVEESEKSLASEQEVAYLAILKSVDKQEGKLFFLDAPGGTGKTFLINLLLAKFRSKKQIAIAVASSGIAATLLQGGRTAHAAFKLPLNLGFSESPTCNIKKGTSVAKVLTNASIIIWDECTMSHKGGIEALDRTLRDLRGKNLVMGGVTMVLSGDFRQTLPVIQRGTRADEVYASIKSSPVWRSVSKLTLSLNMRVHLRGDVSSGAFAKTLLDIGEGTIAEKDGEIEITSSMGILLSSLDDLVLRVFPDISNIIQMSPEWLCERAILTSKNDNAFSINESMLSKVPGEEVAYESVDSVLADDEATNYPVEFLNSLNPPGLPHHRLSLKVGIPIMLLRNLNAPTLCNGTRLRVCTLQRNVIGATVLTGCAAGQQVLIPRIPLIPSDYPFQFKRLQFPVKCCLAMTINKAQGQSFKIAGVDLRDPCFSHGQLYVAFSRVSQKENLFILAPRGTTKNVVYKEALV